MHQHVEHTTFQSKTYSERQIDVSLDLPIKASQKYDEHDDCKNETR